MSTREVKEIRCGWVNNNDPQYIQYHDTEWGKPVHDSNQLFEMLSLAGQQAGISWHIIFKKRDNYRKAFKNFIPERILEMDNDEVNNLVFDKAIVRNRRKIYSIINNAKCFIKMKENNEDFSDFIWSFVNHVPIINNWETNEDIPTQNDISQNMAKALKKRHFTYVGATVCYSYMQSCGLINDHILECAFRSTDNKRRKPD